MEQDRGEAARLYRQAAEQDYPPALCNLGLCYGGQGKPAGRLGRILVGPVALGIAHAKVVIDGGVSALRLLQQGLELLAGALESLHRLLNQMGIHKNDLLILEGFTVIVGIRVHDRSPIYVVWGYYTPPIGFCLWRKRGEPPWRVSLPVNAFAKRFGGKAHVKGCSARWGRSPRRAGV